jgi:HEAT repeat protein
MSKPQPARTKLETSMDLLGSKDGMIRQRSRESLVALGKPAVPRLMEAVQNSERVQVRWEAAKALVAIGDTRSITPALWRRKDPR